MAFRSSRKVRRRSFKKRRPSTKRRRTARRSQKDVHHFRETINAGTIVIPTGISENLSTGAFIMRLSDFPAYQQLGPNFEFARLNKCTIEFIPKFNMQLQQSTVGGGLSTLSASGTLVTAIDQVPIYSSGTAGYVTASSWTIDSSSSSGVTGASAVSTTMTTSYVRGLQGSREKELYKRQKISFYPAFYDYVMTGMTPSGISITNVVNPILGSTITTGTGIGSNGCVERKIKKWISISNLTSATTDSTTTNLGPLYFGPVYALDVNNSGVANVPLFDVRMSYSLSFKRLRANL